MITNKQAEEMLEWAQGEVDDYDGTSPTQVPPDGAEAELLLLAERAELLGLVKDLIATMPWSDMQNVKERAREAIKAREEG